MSDYSLPRIKESELPEATSIDKVRVLDNAGKSVWKKKEDLPITEAQVTGLTSALALKADANIQIAAGAGLTGGGDLSENRTINVNIVNDLVTGGTDNVLSAQQGVVIADILNGMGVQNIMYGVEWDSSVSLTTGTRIGNATLHATLPIQSRMRRCILDVNGDVARYLSPSDSTKTDTGYDADLSGAEGDNMVEMPLHYRKFEY